MRKPTAKSQGVPPATHGSLFLLCLVMLGLWTGNALAADLSGAKDHPLLKRFGGSQIVGYDVKRFDEYDLQTSTFRKFNLATNKREFANPALKLEGTLTRIWYESAGDTSATELIRNYQNELKARGFQILYDSTKDPAATNWTNFLAPFSNMHIKTNRSNYIFYAADSNRVRVTSARLSRPQGDVYVYLVSVEWPGDDQTYKARRGAYVAVDIVELRPMVQNMVVVTADEMSKSLSTSGRVALYGIYFDTNKAEIKPESKPSLEQIARLLKKDSRLKLCVVGHTDNIGGLEFNQNLSRRRAEAVVAALTKQYGVGAGRLSPHGVAYLAPVAVNTTEEGRAKNRRVELVPQ